MKTCKVQAKYVEADYCSWTIVNFKPRSGKGEAPLCVRGDIQGRLAWDNVAGRYTGWFELPAKGEELGFYEIISATESVEQVLQRVNIRYTFDKFYFPPRWENINDINAYLARRFAPLVRREALYRYPRYGRNIQLLTLTDPKVPVSKKQIIFLTGRIHNPESGTTASLFRFCQWLLEGEGREYLREYLFLIIPMVIPLTFEEDPRAHAVNREWRDDTVEPDILAIREKVIDRYRPEAWIDCHTFNAEMDLANKKEMREKHSDYIVAHAPNEEGFDYEYSRDIALRLIRAAEAQGFQHRNRAYFLGWERSFRKGSFVQPGEKVRTRFDPAGVFSGQDYAFYADRDGYGLSGRTWAAMACDYGYDRCHAINMCLESKPLHVYWGQGPFHYPRRFSDSTVIKLQELCRLGREGFAGQYQPGFPCNLVLADVYQESASVVLCAWGRDREALRQSRVTLWRRRRSIRIHRTLSSKGSIKTVQVQLYCVCSIKPVPGGLRFLVPAGHRVAGVKVDGRECRPKMIRGDYLFVPFYVKQGKQEVSVVLKPFERK
ncbi:MAG: hypothetical protein GXY55_19590 [Phycisphaerae bacterium]|nr:hypothetical protein [Phycisphaerae bacterium]